MVERPPAAERAKGEGRSPVDEHLSVYGAALVRERADRVGARARRDGRPRRRFLRARRARIGGALLPALAALAAANLILGAVLLATGAPFGPALAPVVIAALLGVAAVLVPTARQRTVHLLALALAALSVTHLAWAAIVRLTGGASSAYLLVLPVLAAAPLSLSGLPPRAALALGVVAYGALLAAAPTAPLQAHAVTLFAAAAVVVTAHLRHRAALRGFLRAERLGAAVARVRRLQDQLVLVEKLEAMRVLVGGIAHELNNALAVAAVSTQQASKLAAAGESAAAPLKRAEGGLARIRTTVERLRRFAMASEGVLEPADVSAMLDFALESAIGRARSGLVVERAYDPEVGQLECHVSGLAEALYQVARNAVEAMPGGGTLKAAVRGEGDRVILSLGDDGTGMSAGQLRRIFDPYWRGSPEAKRSGMGLSAVYGLVTSLGGSVKVDTAEGKGTTVSIVMPRKRR